MTKSLPLRTPEDLFSEAMETDNLTSGDLRLLTSGLIALRKANEKALNDSEVKAIFGMIAYISYIQKVQETMVCEVMLSHFGIRAVKELPARLYQEIIEYLVDLKMDKVIN